MASSRVFNASRALMAAVKGGATTTTIRVSKPTGPIVIDTAAAPKAPTGIMKPCPISPALRKFLGGAPEASRTHAIKHIWVHIKDQKLQNPANKREIICDEKLKTIFAGKDKVGMMEISKLIGPHFIK